MPKPMDREDKNPWEKVHALKVAKTLLGNGETLSANLCMSKYSPVGGKVKKPAVDWMCAGKQESKRVEIDAKGSVLFEMVLKSRMMVDHSGGVMENATLALHPHFSTPYIPGSAVKGIARHTAWCEWKDAEDPEDKDLYAGFIAEIFGYPTGEKELDAVLKKSYETRSGAIAFLPAQSMGKAKLEADLINSHERGNPVPVFFPAVAAGTTFGFQIVPLKRGTESDIDTLIYFAETWLKQGLKEHGAGAKTNAGYGWFEEVA